MEEDNKPPKKQIKGIWIPIEIMNLFTSKQIGSLEVLLVGTIYCLSASNGKGCWASNSYLAKQLGKTPEWIKQVIRKLRKMGVLQTIGSIKKGGRNYRLIRTYWDLPIKKLDGVEKPPPTGVEIHPGTQGIIPSPNSIVDRKNRRMSAVASDMPTDPFLASPLLQENKTEPKEFDKDIARELWTIVLSTGCRNPKSKVEEWAYHIRLLRKKDNVPKKLIREAIEWYSIHTGQNFVPEIMSGKALRDKWDKLVMAMKRDQQQEVTKKETPEEKEMREIDEYYERQLNKEEELYGTRTGKRIV